MIFFITISRSFYGGEERKGDFKDVFVPNQRKSVNISPEDMFTYLKGCYLSVKSCEIFILKKVVSNISSVQNYLKMMINCAYFWGLFNQQLGVIPSWEGNWDLSKPKKVLSTRWVITWVVPPPSIPVTTRITMFFMFGNPNLILHLPLLLGGTVDG